jgi:hypothetical protein
MHDCAIGRHEVKIESTLSGRQLHRVSTRVSPRLAPLPVYVSYGSEDDIMVCCAEATQEFNVAWLRSWQSRDHRTQDRVTRRPMRLCGTTVWVTLPLSRHGPLVPPVTPIPYRTLHTRHPSRNPSQSCATSKVPLITSPPLSARASAPILSASIHVAPYPSPPPQLYPYFPLYIKNNGRYYRGML